MATPLVNHLGGATFTNPLAITGKAVNAVNTTNVTSKTGSYPTYSSPAAATAAPRTAAVAAPSGGGGSGAAAPAATYSAPVYVDPYAGTVFGSTAKFNQVQGDWNAQRDTTLGSINDRESNDASTYHSGLLDYIDSLKSGQSKIDAQAVQNELARQQGSTGVLQSVSRGLKSGGITLANKNASNSSAAERLAEAYSDIGQRKLTGVDNQYETGKYNIGMSQADLDAQAATGARHLNENKNNIVNNIVSDAQTSIANLNASAANASLPDRIDIEAKKTEIRNAAMAKLQAFDGELASAKPGAASVDTNRATANQLATAGTAAANPFTYTTEIPTQFQDTGPFASDLPLFSLPAPKKQTA